MIAWHAPYAIRVHCSGVRSPFLGNDKAPISSSLLIMLVATPNKSTCLARLIGSTWLVRISRTACTASPLVRLGSVVSDMYCLVSYIFLVMSNHEQVAIVGYDTDLSLGASQVDGLKERSVDPTSTSPQTVRPLLAVIVFVVRNPEYIVVQHKLCNWLYVTTRLSHTGVERTNRVIGYDLERSFTTSLVQLDKAALAVPYNTFCLLHPHRGIQVVYVAAHPRVHRLLGYLALSRAFQCAGLRVLGTCTNTCRRSCSVAPWDSKPSAQSHGLGTSTA